VEQSITADTTALTSFAIDIRAVAQMVQETIRTITAFKAKCPAVPKIPDYPKTPDAWREQAPEPDEEAQFFAEYDAQMEACKAALDAGDQSWAEYNSEMDVHKAKMVYYRQKLGKDWLARPRGISELAVVAAFMAGELVGLAGIEVLTGMFVTSCNVIVAGVFTFVYREVKSSKL
jgi:hypothetical protein